MSIQEGGPPGAWYPRPSYAKEGKPAFNLVLQQLMKMSFLWINGQYQLGPLTQASKAATRLSHDTMMNPQARNENNPCQYMAANKGVQQPLRANYNPHNGGNSNKQPSNSQAISVPHQSVSRQLSDRGYSDFLIRLLTEDQQPSNNAERGNPGLPVSNGFQQAYHENYAWPNTMKAKKTYSQQDVSSFWNQSAKVHGNQPEKTQDVNVVADLQQNNLYHMYKGVSTIPVSQHNTTATPAENVEVVVTDAVHNTTPPYNHNPRPNGTQHGFPSSIPPPSYKAAMHQSYRNNSISTNSRSGLQNMQVSCRSQNAQQYSTHYNGAEATINTNSYSRQHETSLQHSALTQQEMHETNQIARIEEYLRSTVPVDSDGRPVNSSFSNGGKQSVNSNASMSLPVNSGQSLPTTNHSFMPPNHNPDVPLQQSTAPNLFFAQDGSGNGSKAAYALFSLNNFVSLRDAALLKQLPEDVSSQRIETQSSAANNHEWVEIISSVKANASSIHSSPGCTRAVAVVQPLLQESYQDASKQTCSTTVNQLSAEKSAISHSSANNAGTFESDLVSAETHDLSEKQLCADDIVSEVPFNMQREQPFVLNVETSITSKVPVSQSSEKDQSERPTDPKEVLDLSSIPTIPWTLDALTKEVQKREKARIELNVAYLNSDNKWPNTVFGDVNVKDMATLFKRYRDLNYDIHELYNKHVTPDSVILLQVEQCFSEQLKSFHVLKDNEVYSEPPYTSSWLNVNEQLDEIDEEFDFPPSLKHRFESQPDQVQTDNSLPEIIDLAEEKQDSAVDADSTGTASPDGTEIADPSDSRYAFKIQVLSQAEAKVIFEQIQGKLTTSTDTHYHQKRVTKSPVEGELPKDTVSTVSNTVLGNKSVSSVDQVCCVVRCMEQISGSNPAFFRKCDCKNPQNHENISHKTLDMEEIAVHQEDKMCAFRSDSKFHSVAEGMKLAEGDKNVDNQLETVGLLEICTELDIAIDLTETNDKAHCYSDNKPNHLPSSDREVASPMSNLEKNCEQAQLKSTNVAKLSLETEDSQTQAAISSAQTTCTDKHDVVGKRKLIFYPFFQKSKKRKSLVESKRVLEGASNQKVLVCATESEPSASNARTVELVLFGSSAQTKCVLIGSRERHILPAQAVFAALQKPPMFLTVKLSPLKRKSESETAWAKKHSDKQRDSEKSMTAFPQTKRRNRHKLETQKCTFAPASGQSLKKAKKVDPANTEEIPSETGILSGKTRPCLSLKKRRSHSKKNKRGREKKRTVTFSLPADQERSKAEIESKAVMPLQKKDVLKFSVLPKTFNFKDTSNGRKEHNDPVPEISDLVEEQRKSQSQTIKTAMGPWYPNPENTFMSMPLTPTTDGLFHEFQRKYKDKMQPSVDK